MAVSLGFSVASANKIAADALAAGSVTALESAQDQLIGQVEAIHEIAESDERDFTKDEVAVVDAILGKGKEQGLTGKIKAALEDAKEAQAAMDRASVASFIAKGRPGFDDGVEVGFHSSQAPRAMRSSNGQSVVMLSNKESVADFHKANSRDYRRVDCSHPFGELAKMAVCGKNRYTPEIVAAQSGNSNAGGGYLVPDILMPGVVDKARAQSVVIRAGAMTMAMDNSDVMIATVDQDPTFSSVAENAEIPESNVVFGQRKLAAHKIGCIVKASRELVEDAPNFSQMFESVLARSLAVELDRLTLVGTGSAEPLGLLEDPNTPNDAITGTLDWVDVGDSATEVRKENYEPNAVLMSPTNHGYLMHQQAGDGSNSAATWLLAPPSLENQNLFATSNMPETKIVVGQFNMLAWGIRQGALIEVSTNAGTAFQNHQVWFKITFRGDWIPLDHKAFHVATGVTLS